MKFEDWNEELVNRYKSFRASQGCKVSTIGKDLAVIKVYSRRPTIPKFELHSAFGAILCNCLNLLPSQDVSTE